MSQAPPLHCQSSAGLSQWTWWYAVEVAHLPDVPNTLFSTHCPHTLFQPLLSPSFAPAVLHPVLLYAFFLPVHTAKCELNLLLNCCGQRLKVYCTNITTGNLTIFLFYVWTSYTSFIIKVTVGCEPALLWQNCRTVTVLSKTMGW